MIVAAHPDDEVLGCGGSAPLWAAQGASITTLILGEGITSRYDAREDAPSDLVRMHEERARRANASIGISKVLFGGLPDQRFDSLPILDVIKRIEETIAQTGAEAVYVQHGGDLNMDHVVTFRATMTATRPMRGRSVRALYAYPVASSTEWAFGQFAPRFSPTVFADISPTLAQKIAAMQMYESETRAFPHPRSPESLEAASKAWGSQVGLAAAEPFQLIWELR